MPASFGRQPLGRRRRTEAGSELGITRERTRQIARAGARKFTEAYRAEKLLRVTMGARHETE